MKIGILITGHPPEDFTDHPGEYDRHFEALLAPHGFGYASWAVVDGVFPSGPEEADGWLITGSRHGAYEPHDWIAPLEDLIRAILAADKPLVGVCFGHQIIAQALGGRVEKSDKGWIVGPQDYALADGSMVTQQAWHQDQVVELPDGAERIASGPLCDNAAILYPGKAVTVQWHPEFGDGFVAGLLAHRAPGVVPQDRLETAQARLGDPLHSSQIAASFARFFRERSLR